MTKRLLFGQSFLSYEILFNEDFLSLNNMTKDSW